MTARWTVTPLASTVPLDKQRRGEITFVVGNIGDTTDVAVFGPVAGPDVDPSWFTVIEPQRTIGTGTSVTYQLGFAVPADTPPGRYAVAGRVYSATQPPE